MLLTAIEGFYLNVLRVVILVAATLALIAFGLGLTKVGPLISASVGGHSSISAEDQPSLGGWVATQKSAGAPTIDTPDAASPQESLSADMKSALDHISKYSTTRMADSLDMVKVQSALLERRAKVNSDYQNDYDRSLNELMAQVEGSKGTALSVEQFVNLIDWHMGQFNSSVAEKELNREREKAAGLVGLAVAGVALISFLMLVFCFLFVKIERNLRLIHVAERPA